MSVVKLLYGVLKVPKNPVIGGFSIIELLIGSTLFCLAFIMVIGVLPGAFRSTQMTKTFMMATQIATEKLEMASRVPFSTLVEGSTNFPSKKSKNEDNEKVEIKSWANGVEQSLLFYYYYNISPCLWYDYDAYTITDSAPNIANPEEGAELKDVTVTVMWYYGDRWSEVKLHTQVFNR